jgi:hypothetical protein
MDVKLISIFLAGVTIIYAGLLTASESPSIGTGMMILGGILAGMPIWKLVSRFRSSSSGGFRGPAKGKTRQGKPHLKVVTREKKDPITYH